ncbi:MAG: hypothetical protein J6S40_05565 [Thermoguttaceae bacterium]|nr:hypothetical protein [Thermoguttaceae bacterium]
MRRTQRTRRDGGPTVTLFPFLAVLLCTMGMLIMLLVVISRDTAVGETAASAADADPLFSDAAMRDLTEEKETAAPEPPPAEPTAVGTESAPEESLSPEDEKLYARFLRENGGIDPEQLESQRESAEWFLSELEGVRDRTRNELSNERARLAEAETEINRLVTELVELNRQAAALSQESDSASDSGELQKEIDAKAEEIAELNRRIEELQKKIEESEGTPTYAILPYRGKSGTFRRPIYVECDENGIRLMPERVQFVPEDFLVAKYPGNPFDAGLRAARQYFIETGQGDSENEPYPLLILKPESAQTYYIAKSALASWGGEFGYEFVESDAEIEYPRPDPELRRRVEEQVAMARARLAGPIAALLNELEANGRQAQLIDPEDEDSPEIGAVGNGDLASQLGPYARLDSPIGGAESVDGGTGGSVGLSRGASGNRGAGSGGPSENLLTGGTASVPEGEFPGESGGYLPAPSGDSYTAQTGIDRSGFGAGDGRGTDGKPTPLVSDEELLAGPTGETGAPPASGIDTQNAAAEGNVQTGTPAPGGSDKALRSAGDALPSGAVPAESDVEEPTLFAQGDAPYSAAPTTPFAKLPSETSEEKSRGASIDPRQTVGNTTFLSGNQGEADPSAEGADSPIDSGGKPADAKDAPKEPRVKAERDKREINLAEELKKPTQTSIERPITVICKEGTVLFPAQAGARNAREIPLRNNDDRQGVLKEIVAIVHGWHAAGRNMYWSPWLRIQTAPGGEETAARLDELMRSQRVRVERLDRGTP